MKPTEGSHALNRMPTQAAATAHAWSDQQATPSLALGLPRLIKLTLCMHAPPVVITQVVAVHSVLTMVALPAARHTCVAADTEKRKGEGRKIPRLAWLPQDTKHTRLHTQSTSGTHADTPECRQGVCGVRGATTGGQK